MLKTGSWCGVEDNLDKECKRDEEGQVSTGREGVKTHESR